VWQRDKHAAASRSPHILLPLLGSVPRAEERAMTDVDIIDVAAPAGAIAGTLRFGRLVFPCMVGRAGIVAAKREGDGGTPEGLFPLREARYRADRLSTPPKTGLPLLPLQPNEGWCDDPTDAAYNRLVRLPHGGRAETLWRDDHVYDALAVIGWNDAPVLPGAGSAIFLHVMRHDSAGAPRPTSGCVALRFEDLLAVLAACTPATSIRIQRL
jgi:L,D-peptidoglycan transpeptidase YkuD (ErfK/YbiS/YcfS/YnhG family)